MKRTTTMLTAALGLVAWAAAAKADEAVYQRTLRSTVMIANFTADGVATGSGVIVDRSQRLVVTNYHVVRESRRVMVLFPRYDAAEAVIAEHSSYADPEELKQKGHLVEGRVLLRAPQNDLALIQLDRLPENAASIPFASKSPRPGQRVHSIGNPGSSGAFWVYTQGAVRAVYRKQFTVDDDFDVDARIVETQSPTNPGDSGGPVVNDRGELVAVVQSTLAAESHGRARLVSIFIDVSEVRELLEQFRLTHTKEQP